jgi:2-polyprenyl-6-methoxyphenol hydroxylase-like FAD-dependent oxidoreductase
VSRAVVVGGSATGLASALALSELGYEVQVLERDPQRPPADPEQAQHAWPRPTAPQWAHSHAFASLGVNLLYERLPGVYEALLAAGAIAPSLADGFPPTLTDLSRWPEDDEVRMLGCRRNTFDIVLFEQALRHPKVSYESGVTVRGLELAAGADGGPPRAVGVRTGDGRVVTADLVINATGRRSPAARWLAEAGVPAAPDQVESCEITYYTRFFRLRGPRPPGPLNRAFGVSGQTSHYIVSLYLGDNDTFTISIGVLPDDAALKVLRHEGAYTEALRLTPTHAPWIDPATAEPISPVRVMAGLDNSLRGIATTAQSPVLGLFHLGDAAGTTNPAYGRGISLALAHVFTLADLLASRPEASLEQTTAMAVATERLLTPWYAEAVRTDRQRAALWRATVTGQELPPRPPGRPGSGGPSIREVNEAAMTDPVVWRRMVRMMMSLSTPDKLYDDEDIRRRVAEALAARTGPARRADPVPREEFVRRVTAAAG